MNLKAKALATFTTYASYPALDCLSQNFVQCGQAKSCVKGSVQLKVKKYGKNMERQGHGGCDGQDAMAMKTTLTTNAVTTTDKQGHLKQGQRCECPADLTTAEHLKGKYYQYIISILLHLNLSLMFKKYSAYT